MTLGPARQADRDPPKLQRPDSGGNVTLATLGTGSLEEGVVDPLPAPKRRLSAWRPKGLSLLHWIVLSKSCTAVRGPTRPGILRIHHDLQGAAPRGVISRRILDAGTRRPGGDHHENDEEFDQGEP